MRLNTAGNWTVTATDVTDGSGQYEFGDPGRSGGLFQLQVLLPGETAAPGTPTGKTGSPTAQTAGTGYTVHVNAVDANYNLISTNDTVQITSSDASHLAGQRRPECGTGTFSVTNSKYGGQPETVFHEAWHRLQQPSTGAPQSDRRRPAAIGQARGPTAAALSEDPYR